MTVTIAGYHVQEKVYESENSLVYRGHRQVEDPSVILKMLKQAYPPPEKVAWFKREYELTQNLRLEGVISAYELITDHHRPVMVLEDFGGDSLELHLRNRRRRFTVTEFLPLSIQVADILGRVHQQHVMHKDVNPSNIVWNPRTGQVKLIDFGISTALTRENPVPRSPTVGEGTLAYISPEQTGRMNRALDYRTDLYSLGVTFYELLTGQLPFPTIDALALMHAHLARQPTPPEELVPDLPSLLSAIVLKLMAKNAEDRYQSAYGLKTDLEECLRQWQTIQRIDPFPLSQQDIVDRFQLPQKLYGREAEVATLLTAFERVSQGTGELMLVSGSAGIGKSALVREVYKPITRQRGYFITGKFEQFHKNVPYAPLTQAFRSLMRQLLMESEDRIAVWRERLLATLGPNGQVISNVVPEVALIIGPQPPAPTLSSAETRNRLNLVFHNFIRVFTRPEHPLVLFLDDLQWADAASLNLVRLLLTSLDSQYLFVIGAYRDNETHETHSLMLALDEIHKAGSTVNHIILRPLDCPNVCQLVAETLHGTPERVRSLAGLILAKTRGNPFFVNEFLQSLYTEELLTFDLQRRSWQWDLAHIQARDITDNVVELMTGKLQRLGSQTQQVLKLAACIGNQFDLQTLATIYEHSVRETALALWEALEEGLVLPLGSTYKLMTLDVEGLSAEVVVDYKFAHDRIQQSAYSLVPETKKHAMHWRIGQLLLQNIAVDEREQRIFGIVNQLNLGREDSAHQAGRDELAKLNLLAGKKAKAATAYGAACNYFQVGLELLGEGCWKGQYDLTLALHVEAAEAAYLNGDYVKLEKLTKVVLQQVQTLLDKVKVYECSIEAGYTEQSKIREGIKIGLEVLDLLGIRLPERPSKTDIQCGLEETQLVLTGKNIEDLANLPEMTDPYKLAAVRILMRLFSPAYVGSPELFLLINFSVVNLSVRHGNMSLSARAYAAYGLFLCSVVGDIDAGYRLGKLALSLVDRFNAKEIEASTVFMVNVFVRHWKEHLRETIQPLREAYKTGLETGAVEYAALSLYSHASHAYRLGKELGRLEKEISEYSNVIGQLKQGTVLHLTKLCRQAILNLIGRAADPCRLVGESYNEEAMLPLLLEANNVNALSMVFLNKLILCYLFHDYPQAVTHAAMTERYLHGTRGTWGVPLFHLYDSLVRTALFPDTQEYEQKSLLEKITANQEKMKNWAQHAPMNYLHKFYLVEAECARVLGKDGDAREYYDKAITLAHENEYLNEEALAYELAGRFYLARDQSHLARYYLHDAHYAYLRWGALAKVRDLETRYPQVFSAQVAPTLYQTANNTSTAHTEQHISGALDVTSVLKASRAVTSEIVLDRMLATLMNSPYAEPGTGVSARKVENAERSALR